MKKILLKIHLIMLDFLFTCSGSYAQKQSATANPQPTTFSF